MRLRCTRDNLEVFKPPGYPDERVEVPDSGTIRVTKDVGEAILESDAYGDVFERTEASADFSGGDGSIDSAEEE